MKIRMTATLTMTANRFLVCTTLIHFHQFVPVYSARNPLVGAFPINGPTVCEYRVPDTAEKNLFIGRLV